MVSSTSEKQNRARAEKAARERTFDKDVTEVLMSHPSSRNWVWRQLEFAQLFVGDESLDPYRMAFDKGRRNTGLRLLKDVQGFCPREYILMVEENARVRLTEPSPSEEGTPDE